MKKLLFGLFGIVTIFLVVLIAPTFIDWSHYKSPIIEAVKKHTGFEVDLKGEVRFSLFPSPHLIAKDVSVKNTSEGTTKNLIDLKSISLAADFLPLLHGNIIISQVELINPIIYLETFKNGQNNWDIKENTSPSNQPPITPNPKTSTTQDSPKSKSLNFSLQKIKIKEGFVTFKNLQTDTLQEVKNINLEGSIDALTTGPFSVKGQLDFNEYTIKGNIQTGVLNSGRPSPVEATISATKGTQDYGTLQAKGTLQDKKFIGDIKSNALKIPFSLDLKNKKIDLQKGVEISGHVEATSKNIKVSNLEAHIDSVKIKGNAFYNNPQIDLQLAIIEGPSMIDFSASGQSKEKVLWDGTIKLQADNPQPFLLWFDVDKTPYLQGKINLSAHLRVDPNAYSATTLKLKIGSLESAGNISIQLGKVRPYIKADMVFNALNLNVLLPGTATHQKHSTISHGHTHLPIAETPQSSNTVDSKHIPPVPAHWSKDNWNLESLKAINTDFKFQISDILYEAYHLHHTSGTLHLQDGNLHLTSFQTSAYDGTANGALSIQQGTSPSFKLECTLKNLNLASLPKVRQTPLKKAILSGSGHLSATGHNPWEAINTLSGNIHIALTNGIIESFNVRKLITDIKHVETPIDIYGLKDALNTKSETHFSYLKADFAIQQGKANTHNIEFLSQDLQVHANGIINLPQWLIDMSAQIKVKEIGKLPTLPMKIEGPLESPSYKIDENIFAEILLRTAAGNLLNEVTNVGGDVGKVINGLLGTEPASSQKKPTKSHQEHNDVPLHPEKMLKNLLGL